MGGQVACVDAELTGRLNHRPNCAPEFTKVLHWTSGTPWISSALLEICLNLYLYSLHDRDHFKPKTVSMNAVVRRTISTASHR